MHVDSHLSFTAGHGSRGTYLKDSFSKQPFRLRRLPNHSTCDQLNLIVTSSSPGILSNDNYKLQFYLEENSNVFLSTQAYQRLYTMQQTARQSQLVTLEENARFFYLPYPSVPHRNSSFLTRSQIFLSKKHTLFWTDIFTCGRNSMRERFDFTSYTNLTEISVEDTLIVREMVKLEPGMTDVDSFGQFEGFTHAATIFFLDHAKKMEEVATAISEILQGEKNVVFGITRMAVNGVCIKVLGFKGEQLFDIARKIANLSTGRFSVAPASH